MPKTSMSYRVDRVGESFERFRRDNPHVEQELLYQLDQYFQAGVSYVSIKHVWEVMRHRRFQTHGEFRRLNNDYPARYARVIAAARPELGALLRMRRLAHEPTPEERAAIEAQGDAFPETSSGTIRGVNRTALQRPGTRGKGDASKRTHDRVAGTSYANIRRGDEVACGFHPCGVIFVARQPGQKFHAARCRTAQWMLDHPRVER